MHEKTKMQTSEQVECAVRAAAEAGWSCSRLLGTGLPETLVGKGFWAVQLSSGGEQPTLSGRHPVWPEEGGRREEEAAAAARAHTMARKAG